MDKLKFCANCDTPYTGASCPNCGCCEWYTEDDEDDEEERIMGDNTRLTLTTREMIDTIKSNYPSSGTYQMLMVALDHCLELLDAEEQGLLMKLPCKIGTPIFRIHKIMGEKSISQGRFEFTSLSEFGRRVFLTPEAAEAALKEL